MRDQYVTKYDTVARLRLNVYRKQISSSARACIGLLQACTYPWLASNGLVQYHSVDRLTAQEDSTRTIPGRTSYGPYSLILHEIATATAVGSPSQLGTCAETSGSFLGNQSSIYKVLACFGPVIVYKANKAAWGVCCRGDEFGLRNYLPSRRHIGLVSRRRGSSENKNG